MTLENAKVLHKHFMTIGRNIPAEQLEKRYPELKEESAPEVPEEPEEPSEEKEEPAEEKEEVEDDGSDGSA